jgi:glutaredoxin
MIFKNIELWTEKDCEICHEIKAYLADQDIYFRENVIDSLEDIDGDLNVMAQLCEQNMELPVCEVDGEFVLPNEFISTMQGMI